MSDGLQESGLVLGAGECPNSVPFFPFKKGSRDTGIKTVLSIHWKPKSIWTIFLLNFGAVVLLRGQHFNSFNLKHRI